MLLSERERSRRSQRPVSLNDELRYTKVKRSMGAIKHVLAERKRIRTLIASSSTGSDGSVPEVKPDGELSGEVKPGFKKFLKRRVFLKKKQRRRLMRDSKK